jgi:FemAB-related protein (PEP-CTERM system-associated)
MMQVERFSGDPAAWDSFAESQRGYTHYHRYGWRTVMESVFGHTGIYLVARRDDKTIAGVLPLIRLRSALFGHQLCSMPFLNYGGALGDDDAVRALTTAALDEARRQRIDVVELRSRVPLPIDLPVSTHKITATLELSPGHPELFWKALPSSVRNQVRKPQKAGVEMRFGADQIIPFFHVFARNMRDLGTPTHTVALFEAIARTFPQDVIFGCGYVDGVAVAGGCAIVWGSEIEMVWGSTLREYNRSHAPNMLLYWSFMELACQRGLRVFNFGRCTAGSSTHRFKRQWGARDEPLYWYGPHVAQLADEGAAEKWGPRVWRHLPLPVANRIGPLVRRGISA